MSMLPASRVELKKGLTIEQIRGTAEEVRSIAGAFNVLSRGEPVVLIVNTTNLRMLDKIRALPHVAQVRNQF